MSKADFLVWYRISKLNVEFRRTLYDMHVSYIASIVQAHPFIRELATSLEIWDKESISISSYPLLMDTDLAPFHQKSFDSFIDKVFRNCLVYNDNFPLAPRRGWITHENFAEKVNDLVRNKITCKFLDGPEITAKKIVLLAEKHGLTAQYSSRNADDGYYAYHVYITFPVAIDTGKGPVVPKRVDVEIQISTQLKEVMYEILHKFYADDRSKIFQPDWKWDIESLKFKSGYLSHTLHLLESMIVELRNKL